VQVTAAMGDVSDCNTTTFVHGPSGTNSPSNGYFPMTQEQVEDRFT